MTDEIAVRPATVDDVGAIVELGLRATTEQILSVIEDDRVILVAVDSSADDRVIGWTKSHYWAEASPPAPAGHWIGGLIVADDYRRRGIGQRLMRELMDALDTDEFWSAVNATNARSLELHRQLGFVEVTRAPELHSMTFTGGVGVLLRYEPPVQPG